MLGNTIPLSSWLSIAILSSISGMGVYAETMIMPAIPDIIKSYHLEYDDSSWIIGSFIISGAIMTPVSGQLSDIYGKKNILIIMVIIYAIGAIAGGFGRDFYSLIASRVLQGVGLSIVPVGLSIMSDLFPKEKIAIGQGVFSTITASGGVAGLILGGYVIQSLGWKSIFFLVAPITAIIIVLIWIIIPSNKNVNDSSGSSTRINMGLVINEIQRMSHCKKQHKATKEKLTLWYAKPKNFASNIDIRGIITLSISSILFLIVLTNFSGGSSFSFHISELQIVLVVIGLASLIFFIKVEKTRKIVIPVTPSNTPRSSSSLPYSHLPIVDFSLLRNNNAILLSIFLLIISGFLMYTIFHTIPILSRSPYPEGYGENAVATSNMLLFIPIASLIAGPVTGFIIYKIGAARSIIISTLVIAIGYITITTFYLSEFYMPVHLFLISIGYLFINTAALNLIILSVPKNMTGTSLGVAVFLKYIGAAIGPTISGMYMWTSLSAIGNHNINNNNTISQFIPSIGSYHMIFLYCTVIAITSVAIALTLSRVSPKCQNHTPEERGDIGEIASSLIDEITKWEGIMVRPHPFGGFQFKLNGADIGHVHGDKLADLPLSSHVRQKISLLKKDNDINHHPAKYQIYRETGWVAYYLNDIQDLSVLLQHFKSQYERIRLC
jgi:MFS family permease